ncbi:MAG: Gldg family protein [Gammaproteobacteria bacterium]
MNTNLITGSGLVIALALFLGVNIISNQTLTSMRLDVTENKLHTLSEGTYNILQSIDEPITVRFYFSTKQFANIPQYNIYGRRVRDMLEEYATLSDGMINLQVIDPEPFSEAEDQAVGFGIEPIPLNSAGEKGYLGLVATNSTDDEIPIPIMSPDREQSLEYDLTKIIYTLNNPKKRKIGLLTRLPVLANSPDPATGKLTEREWGAISLLKEVYDVTQVSDTVTEIDAEIDTLIVIHPKKLSAKLLYALDQFVLRGGRAMIFVDPFAEQDQTQPDPENPMVMPDTSSDLAPLFAKWGLQMVDEKVVGDIGTAVRVQFRSETGPQEVEYLPWLSLQKDNLNADDFVTNQLNSINVGSAGALKPLAEATTTFTPLIQTTEGSGLLDRGALMFVRNPADLLQNFEPDGEKLTLAVRVQGEVETAYPDGKPLDATESRAPGDDKFLTKSSAPINVIVVSDTDILADRFWVSYQNFLGMQMPQAFANNADFLINAIDNLGGNDDLISLRSRGEYSRPFTVVQQIQKDAEARFRDREQALQSKLEETESKIEALQQQSGGAGETILSAEQRKEIELFRKEQLKTRKELRAVQHDLQKNIEQLGTKLKFVNIGLIPILILLFAVGLSVFKLRRQNA